MKKLWILVLILSLTVSLFACGRTSGPEILDEETVTPPASGQEPATPDEPVSEPDDEQPLVVDYETASHEELSRTGFGSSRWDGALPLVTDGYEIKIGMKTNSQVLDYETNKYTLWLEEQTGLQITVVEFVGSNSDIATQTNLMITGGEDLPDIMMFTSGTSKESKKEYLREGYLVNLAGYFQTDCYYLNESLHMYYDTAEEYNAIFDYIVYNICDSSEGGGVFAFPTVYNAPTDLVNTQIMINSEWLKNVGMEKPTTIDELYDVLVAFRDKDPNGNGLKDEIPMIGRHAVRGRGVDMYLINAFIQYSNTRKLQIEDGKVFACYDQDEYREALKFMNKLVKEGLLSELAFTATNSDIKALLSPAEGQPFTVGICTAWIDVDYSEQAIYAYEPIGPLKDAGFGRGGYGITDIDVVEYNDCIMSTCERPEIAFRLMDFMRGYESYLRLNVGEYGVNWEYLDSSIDGTGKGLYGGTARVVRIGEWVYTGTNNQTWHIQPTVTSPVYWQKYIGATQEEIDANKFSITTSTKLALNMELQHAAGNPPEVFDIFYRTEEEDEIFYEYNSELSSYIQKARAEFCVGTRDPYSDADWQNYLKDLESLHLYECWVEIGQASYDRQKAAG